MLFATTFAVSGINYNDFFKKGHVIEARVFVMLMILGISYIASKFIIDFVELM
jgi:uncharacterized integral membrane protein (TIGR02327 family)